MSLGASAVNVAEQEPTEEFDGEDYEACEAVGELTDDHHDQQDSALLQVLNDEVEVLAAELEAAAFVALALEGKLALVTCAAKKDTGKVILNALDLPHRTRHLAKAKQKGQAAVRFERCSKVNHRVPHCRSECD